MDARVASRKSHLEDYVGIGTITNAHRSIYACILLCLGAGRSDCNAVHPVTAGHEVADQELLEPVR